MAEFSGCESCTYYVYNEDYESYECMVSLDEDEYARYLSAGTRACPYYNRDDEYKIVKKQA